LITKLWNVARFSERFLVDAGGGEAAYEEPSPAKIMDPSIVLSGEDAGGAASPLRLLRLSPADRWILACTQRLIRRATDLFRGYDYAAAKSEIEAFFWRDLADNYLEMAKLRLYSEDETVRAGASFTLYHVLLATLKLFAPFLPHVTEEIYQHLFAASDGAISIHLARWPEVDARFEEADAEAFGERLVEIATAVRRYKSERGLSLGAEIGPLCLAASDAVLAAKYSVAVHDLISVTRAQRIDVVGALDGDSILLLDGAVQVALRGV
jgi:valyl-tRNA synthetase